MIRFSKKSQDDTIRERLGYLKRNLQATVIQFRMHDELLQDFEREQLSATWKDDRTKNIASVARLRGRTENEMIVEFALELNFITAAESNLLLVALGAGATGSAMVRYAEGVLSVNGQIARKVKRYREPSRVEQVLLSFQEQNWPSSTKTPKGITSRNIGNVLSNLNTNTKLIRFAAHSGGKEIGWERTPNEH